MYSIQGALGIYLKAKGAPCRKSLGNTAIKRLTCLSILLAQNLPQKSIIKRKIVLGYDTSAYKSIYN